LLQASGNAVVISGSPGNLVNYGTVRGGVDGVDLKSAGSTVTNYGAITGTNLFGVDLYAGGSATNASTGVIQGRYDGVIATYGAGTVVNRGTIIAANSYGSGTGVNLTLGGFVTNQTGGFIQGYYGITIGGSAGTVTNFGTITGTDAVGVYFGVAGSTLTNAGTITGGGAGISRAATTGSSSIRGRCFRAGSTAAPRTTLWSWPRGPEPALCRASEAATMRGSTA